MKLTPKQKQKIASEIRGRYANLDSLPMEGWAWEFFRRNRQYIEAFSKLEKEVEGGVWNDESKATFSKLFTIVSDNNLLFVNLTFEGDVDRENFLVMQPPPPSHYYYEEQEDNEREFTFPRPEKRYIDFARHYLFHSCEDYSIIKSLAGLLRTMEKDDGPIPSYDDIYEIFQSFDRDVFYIRVSKNAKIINLKEKMLTDISKFLRKPVKRIRDRKWKYYLVVYDLKHKFGDGISYDEIAEILIEAYPVDETEYFNETRNINNWYNQAVSLINGGFTKYLK